MECVVCLNLRSLFSLPCGHEFCAKCHNQFGVFGTKTCPLCRAPFKKYGTFEQRLATFTDWEYGHIVDAASLAANGFVRRPMRELWAHKEMRQQLDLTYRDAVQCIDCGMAFMEWESGDTARGEHRRYLLEGERCRFVPMKNQ